MDTRTTVVLADGSAMVREGLKLVLEATGRFRVVGEAESGKEAVQLARETEPQILLVDGAIRAMGVIQVIRALSPLRQGTSVVVLTDPEDHSSQEHIIEAGARGCINKIRTSGDLVMVVELVAAGRTRFPRHAARLVHRRKTNWTGIEARLARLSEKERMVLAMTARGFSAREIAVRIHLSPKSVYNYRCSGQNKLGVSTRSEAVDFAMKAGLLDKDLAAQ